MPLVQDHFLQLREVCSGDQECTPEMLLAWKSHVKEMNEILRQRLFILTIAAEEGWATATEVAFRKKGEGEKITYYVRSWKIMEGNARYRKSKG